jgi:hypothetical protein
MAAIADAFSVLFNTSLDNTVWNNFTSAVRIAPPLFLLRKADFTMLLRPGVSSLKDGLTSLLGNVTLLLIRPDHTTTVTLQRFSDRIIYEFHISILCATYGIAFLLSGVATALGIRAFRANGVPRSFTFSEFLVTTHGRDLDPWAKAGMRDGGLTEELNAQLAFDGKRFVPSDMSGSEEPKEGAFVYPESPQV